MKKLYLPAIILLLILTGISKPSLSQFPGTRIIMQNGYKNCIELSNSGTRVVLEPNVGGRILIYEYNGRNILYVNPEQNGQLYKPGEVFEGELCGGRFDIGPEMTIPKHPALFYGGWDGEIIGPREAWLISQQDTSTGVQLIRKFRLDEKTSRLEFTQIIRNVSQETRSYCHWSRTFAKGGGISLTPVNENSRYPRGYLIYSPNNVMDYLPADEPNVAVRQGILEITGPPVRPKFVIDCPDGWLAYISRDNQLFIKKFMVFPDRQYGEMAANNASIWYYKEQMCEIEPIGPMEILEPGEEASFTEVWWLLDYDYPVDRIADLEAVKNILKGCE